MVMSLTQKLDEAKKAVEASTTRAQDGAGKGEQVLAAETPADPEFEAFEEMEMDDDLVAVVARRIAPPRGDDEREEEFQDRLKASIAELKGGRLSVAGRGFVVEKTSKQK